MSSSFIVVVFITCRTYCDAVKSHNYITRIVTQLNHIIYDRGIEQVRKAGRGKIKPFLLKNNPALEQSQSAVERD